MDKFMAAYNLGVLYAQTYVSQHTSIHDRHHRGLEKKVTSVIAIGSLIVSILFISNNLTGNAIAINSTASNWTGGVLFIIGLVASLIYFKKRTKNSVSPPEPKNACQIIASHPTTSYQNNSLEITLKRKSCEV